jgi:hypothetical protein
MEFFHPDRKHLLTDDGPPLLENYQSVIPHLMIYPEENANTWVLSCFLPNAYNSYAYHQVTCTGPALNQLLAEYVANPEAFFKDSMKWYPPEVKAPTTTKQPARLNLTIEDLGL